MDIAYLSSALSGYNFNKCAHAARSLLSKLELLQPPNHIESRCSEDLRAPANEQSSVSSETLDQVSTGMANIMQRMFSQ